MSDGPVRIEFTGVVAYDDEAWPSALVAALSTGSLLDGTVDLGDGLVVPIKLGIIEGHTTGD